MKDSQETSSACAVNSVLAIGGVGGLAVGLAGREILENLFTGLIILSSSPFEVGDEVLFSPPSGQVQLSGLLKRLSSTAKLDPAERQGLQSKSSLTGLVMVQTVEGIVVDVGWYRTTIRSFEREIFCIPNSVFSRNVVLNVTRKQREWRFYEFIGEQSCSIALLFSSTCFRADKISVPFSGAYCGVMRF